MRDVTRQSGAAGDFDDFLNCLEKLIILTADVAGVDTTVLGHSLRQCHELVGVGKGAGHINQAGRHAPRAVAHAGSHQLFHLLQFFFGGRTADFAHHLIADGAVRNEMRDVGADAARRKLFVKLAGIAFAAAAVTRNKRRAALRQIATSVARFGRQNCVVAVVVQVDEAGADHQAAAIDGLPGGANFDVGPHGDDHSILDGNAAFIGRAAGAVDNRATFEQDVDLFWLLRKFLSRRATRQIRSTTAEQKS